MRDEMPTLPYDLSEFARAHTGPFSWTDDTTFDDEPLDEIVAGPLVGVRRSDVPCVAARPDGSVLPALDHRQYFVLSLLDGCSSVENLIDSAGLPESETLTILCELCARGVVFFEPQRLF
jgi:hypothetical protein